MKRKSLIVLLVLLLVGILAFTVFACNNDKPNKPNTGTTPGGEGPGPDDDDPPEEETYAIVEALPKLVTGLDKVAATVGDINEGKAAYLGADIGLNFGVTAEGLDVAADLDLSLKVSVDEAKAANNWALIGLKSDNKEVAQLFIHAEEKNKEVIYIKEALTGNDNWKRLSVLDTSDSDLTGLFTTPGGVEPDANYNDEGVAGFDTETGYHHVYSGGLIGRLFGLIDVMTNGTKVGEEYMFAKPVYKTEGTGDDEHEVFVGYAPEGGAPVIDFGSDSPIGGLEIMEGSKLNQLLGTVKLLGKVVDGALHAEAFDNGNRYVATLNRAGIGDLIGGLTGTFDLGDLVKTLEKLNPVLRLVLGMEVKDGKFNVLKYDDPADAPVLDIEFSVDPETAALTDLSIDFANGDIEGMGITLGLALSNIELSDKSSKAPDTETAGAEDLGINLALQAKLPAWPTGAAIAVSINPNAVIGFDSEGYVQVDLSGIAGHATFNNATIAEYTTYNSKTGFAINLKPVYEFIAKDQTGDLRDQVYFIPCDLESIINNKIKPSSAPASAETIQNAAFADETENETENETGTLGTLIDAIKALSKPGADILGGIGNIIGPALTDSNSIVKLLLAEITKGDSLTFKPALGAEIDDEIIITLDAPALVEFAMGKNLLGGAESQINITLYDASNPDSGKQPITLSDIFEGDLVDVMIDLVYTTMFENYQKTNPEATFAGYMASQTKPTDIVNSIIKPVAEKWNITVLKDGALTVSDIGDITATINMGSNGVNGLGITLGAFFVEDEDSGDSVPSVWVSLIGNLNKYTAGTSISLDKVDSVITSWNEFNKADGLQNALMELAVYALGVDIAA